MSQSERITDKELERLGVLEAAATTGPWGYNPDSDNVLVKTPVFTTHAESSDDPVTVQMMPQDASLLFPARNALPKLITEVKALRILAGKSKCVDCERIGSCTGASAHTAHCTAWRKNDSK